MTITRADIPHVVTASAAVGLPRSTLVVAAVAYLAFVLYGSLVPLNFQPVPFEAAWARFLDIPNLHLGIGSRADWVANILLFIPLAFLSLGVTWSRSTTLRLAATLAVVTACVALAVGLEFTQIFFPPRTVSRNDIVAESTGAFLGVAAWWLVGPRASRWLGELPRVASRADAAHRLLALYLFGLFVYALLPLDLTLSPVEILRKLRDGRLVLVPFLFHEGQWSETIYSFGTEIALWVPVGVLVARASGRTAVAAWGWAVGLAALLEFLQLFVHSRTSDVNDVLAAMVGAFAGVAIAGRRGAIAHVEPGQAAHPNGAGWLPWSVGLFAWATVAVLLFWYPFDFDLRSEFLRERLLAFRRVPFESYYWGTEYNAITQLLRKTIFFVPLGALFAERLRLFTGNTARVSWIVLGIGTAVVAAFGLEFGQLALPNKILDVTDPLLQVCGALAGGGVVAWLLTRGASPSQASRLDRVESSPSKAGPESRLLTPFLGAVLYVALLTLGALHPGSSAILRQYGVMDALAAACGLFTLVAWFHSGRGVPYPRRVTSSVAVALCTWVLISAAGSLLTGSWSDATTYRVRQFVIATTLYLVTSNGFGHPRHVTITAGLLGTIVAVAGLSGAVSLDLNQNIAAFSVLALPLLGAAFSVARPVSRVAFGALALAAFSIVLQTRNRGAAVGLGVLALAMAAQSRRRTLVIGGLAAAAVVGAVVFANTGYAQRFVDVWQRGPDFASVQERLDLWTAGLRMSADHPVLGVGPGNFPERVGVYAPALARTDPHNHLVAVLSETGVVGALLYISFFGVAAAMLWRVGQRRREEWQGSVARWFVGGLAAWFAVGFFLGLQTNAIAFMFAGAAAALSQAKSARRA